MKIDKNEAYKYKPNPKATIFKLHQLPLIFLSEQIRIKLIKN